MKKSFLTLLISLLAFAPLQAQYPDGYYDSMDGRQREALKSAARNCVESHRRLGYSDLPNYWVKSDIYPELYDGLRRWWEMYSNNIYLIEDGQTGKQSFSFNKMQREHAVPKSWWKKGNDVEYTPAYSDMWNLYPSDGPANQAKLNYPLGPVKNASFDNGISKVGAPMGGFGGGSGSVFEPGDEYKGDFARAFFYMATVYDDLPWKYTYMFQQNEWPTLRTWAVDMLLDWARRDPVSQKEIDRNNAVEECQGNRNPFIDFPELAEYIWGNRSADVFYIDEQGSTPVIPPIDGDPEIMMPVDGEALDFGEAAVGSSAHTVLQIQGKNLTAPLSIRVAGADRAMFIPAVSTIPASTINTREVYSLPIVFTPTSTGSKSATVILYDGGLGGGNNITVTLKGEALEVPRLTAPVAYDATDITAEAYTASWSAVPEIVDFYVLNRVRYLDDGATGSLMECDGTSVRIEGRDPGVMESYTVYASRLGYLSEASNSVTVAADSSVKGVGDIVAPEFEVCGGEVRVLGDSDAGAFMITDIYGRVIVNVGKCRGGDTYRLPSKGIYILVSGGRSRKIIF